MNKMDKKYVIIMVVLFLACIAVTTLIITNVLNQKFLSVSFGLVGLLQTTLGFYQFKNNNKAFRTSFISAAILIIAGLIFIFV